MNPAPDRGAGPVSEPPPPRMRGTVSIRWSLLRSLILLIAGLSTAVLTVTWIASRHAVTSLCGDLVRGTADRVEAELRRGFEPISEHLFVLRDYAASGLLDLQDPNGLNRTFGPLIERNSLASSVNTGDPDGNGYLLLRDADGWRNRIVTAETVGRSVEWRIYPDNDARPRAWTEQLDYDPRDRPWYELAAPGADPPSDTVRWTEPYVFFTTGDPGITVSIALRDAADHPWALAVDLMLRDISRYTTALEVSPGGCAYVLAADGRVIGLPRPRPVDDDPDASAARPDAPPVLSRPDELGRSEIAVATSAFLDRPASDAPKPDGPMRFRIDDGAWWGLVRPARIRNGPPLWIGVAVPERDFLGEIRRQRTVHLVLAAIAVVAAVAIALALAARYSTPIRALIDQSERIRTLDTSVGEVPSSRIAEIRRLGAAQENMRAALDSFARYVPREVVRDLLDRGEAAIIGGRQRTLSILFTDIVGFTSVSESMDPQGLTDHMAGYFEMMLGTLLRHRATIDKLIGDAVVAFWSAPNPDPDHARNAVLGTLACHEELRRRNEAWTAAGRPPLPTRFGLATGPVVVGNVGAPTRLSYTVLGDPVNLASRLEAANTWYGTRVLVSDVTRSEAGDGFAWRRVDVIRVKGRSEPETIHELLGTESGIEADTRAWAADYESALDRYRDRAFAEAIELLDDLAARRPDDLSVRRLRERCDDLQRNPPPDGWDGVTTYSRKTL